VEDKSNKGNKYHRNRIRNDLIPYIREHLNKEISDDLIKLSQICLKEELAKDAWLERFTNDFTEPGAKSIGIDREALIQIQTPTAYEVLRSAISRLKGSLRSLEYKHIETLYDFFSQPSKLGYQREIHLPGLLIARRKKDQCSIEISPNMQEKRKAKALRAG